MKDDVGVQEEIWESWSRFRYGGFDVGGCHGWNVEGMEE